MKISTQIVTRSALILALAMAVAARQHLHCPDRVDADLGRFPQAVMRRQVAIGGAQFAQVRDQFNAEVAVLRLDEGDGSLAGIAVGPDGPRPERTLPDTDPLLVQARSEGRVRVSTDRTMDTSVLAALAERQAWDVLVVPLRSGDRDRGYLELHDRLSRWDRFRDEDISLANRDAMCFPIRLLRLANGDEDCAAVGFAELARQVGLTKQPFNDQR